MRRVLAIIAVAALIALALAVRARTQSQRQQDADARNAATLYCVVELRPVCDAVAADDHDITVVAEEAGTTLTTLTRPDFNPAATKFDGWLAPTTFVAQVDDIRARASLPPLFDAPSRILARTPVVGVMWNDRQQILARACGGPITWRCVGDHAGDHWTDLGGPDGWGDFQPAFPPETSATGLHDIAAITNSWFGSTTYGSNDFHDPGFSSWLSDVATTSAGVTATAPVPLERLLGAEDHSIGVAASLEAIAAVPVTQGRDNANVSILYPAPVVTADVVLAPSRGDEPGGRLKTVLEADAAAHVFAGNGWRVDGQPLGPGLSSSFTLPASDGLPSTGVMETLGATWQTAAR
jgi:hypothetical protein